MLNLYDKEIKLTKNKNLEVQVAYINWTRIFNLDIEIDFAGRDHAGPRFCLVIIGLMLNIDMYDSRHWDYETNDWEKYD